ncbi:MAG: GFA family protein [Marichromatium sp.]|nr:GFA family protein [Marichromatium sp.]
MQHSMKGRHHGSCLCGRVRFEIEGDFDSFYLCYCTYCQKDTGSAHAANLFSQSARLHWIEGKAHVKTFQLPNTLHEKSFCIHCGSALPTRSTPDAPLVVPAGCLDSVVGRRPDAKIYVENQAAWTHQNLDELPRFSGPPAR